MAKWIIENGLFEAARMLMDDEICDCLNLECETDLEFLNRYMEEHEKKYGVEFIVA